MATLVRYTNFLIIIYIALYDVYSFGDIKKRAVFIFSHIKKLLLLPVIAALLFIPQLIYWKHISGEFLIYSYGDESFIYWNQPKIFSVLFDVQNGWLIYSPIMIFALVGIVMTLFRKTCSSPGILVTFFIATWVFASWWAWWFGGAFGYRSYIEYYAILSLPMAFAFDSIIRSKTKTVNVLFYSLFILFIYYNIGMTTNYASPWDGPGWDWNAYLKVLKKLILY